jgi:hypothetical protein
MVQFPPEAHMTIQALPHKAAENKTRLLIIAAIVRE